MDETKSTPPQQEIGAFVAELFRALGGHLERQSKFKSVYANNFRLESSVWDLKVLLGQLEQHTGTFEIDWHTAVTMPWAQAKILDYYLRLNIAYHEKSNGAISIPSRVSPPPPVPPTEETIKSDPNSVELYEMSKKVHAEMFD